MRGILSLAVLALSAGAASAQQYEVVEQTVADGRGGAYTRIVTRPVGQASAPAYRPATFAPVYVPPAYHAPAAQLAPRPYYAPQFAQPWGAPATCANGRCGR